MKFPENVKYSKDHEWILVEGETALVGITDFAQGELGEIVYVDITSEGDSVGRSEVFGSIEAVKTVSDMMMPVTGTVLEINPELEDAPELINQDPYGKGWIVKISVEKPEELDDLLSVEEYKKYAGK